MVLDELILESVIKNILSIFVNLRDDDDDEVTNENIIVNQEKEIKRIPSIFKHQNGKRGYLVNEKKLGNDSGLCLMRQYIEF